MISGVSFPSWPVVWSGSWSVDFPVTNLGDLRNIRRVAAGGTSARFDLVGGAKTIRFVGVAHHNGQAGATVTVALDSGASKTVTVPALAEGFAQVLPVHFDTAQITAGGTVTFAGNSVAWEVGGIEVSDWWAWPDVNVERSLGLKSNAHATDVGDGVVHMTRQWSPRVVSGGRDTVDLAELDTTAVDFQMVNGRHRPFVWAEDVQDPTTWARECILVTNASLPPPQALGADYGAMAFDFVEHLG